MIRFKTWGSYRGIKRQLKVMKDIDVTPILDKYGRIGVERLKDATPVRTGLTRDSWNYRLDSSKKGKRLIFYNTNREDDMTAPVVILLIHGHISVEGTWIEGHDFVSDIIEELCNEIKEEI